MIEIIIGLILMFLLEPKDKTNVSANEEIIRPILMEDFHKGDHTNDGAEDFTDFE